MNGWTDAREDGLAASITSVSRSFDPRSVFLLNLPTSPTRKMTELPAMGRLALHCDAGLQQSQGVPIPQFM